MGKKLMTILFIVLVSCLLVNPSWADGDAMMDVDNNAAIF